MYIHIMVYNHYNIYIYIYIYIYICIHIRMLLAVQFMFMLVYAILASETVQQYIQDESNDMDMRLSDKIHRQ